MASSIEKSKEATVGSCVGSGVGLGEFLVSQQSSTSSLPSSLPDCRGRITRNASLARRVWFKCAGLADILFEPQDEEDLLEFLKNAPKMPITMLGAGSNVLISSAGLRGLVVILSAAFAYKAIDAQGRITAGAALGDAALARFALKNAQGGLEFYTGIPGTIGAAVRMNAGAEGVETKDRLIDARVIDHRGAKPIVRNMTNAELGFRYRGSAIKPEMIVVSARFATKPADAVAIAERMAAIRAKRERTQPIAEKTGGSTFKNPTKNPNCEKAWRLIEEAGMRGARLGGAEVSHKHCNFLINREAASPEDIKKLAEKVREQVVKKSGVKLEWEIVRLGWGEEEGCSNG